MKNKRTIVIKDPRWRKIRKNLRNILLEWGNRRLNELFETRDMVERNDQGKLKKSSELTDGERAKIGNITHQITRIRRIKDASICQCTVCGSLEKDMTYNPVKEEWFCVDCYKLNLDFYKDTNEAYFYP